MQVTVTHHIDSSEPDESGMYDYYYEYDIFDFHEDGIRYAARSYTDDPLEVHFTSIKRADKSEWELLSKSDMSTSIFERAVSYLKENGKINIRFLGEGGYQDI